MRNSHITGNKQASPRVSRTPRNSKIYTIVNKDTDATIHYVCNRGAVGVGRNTDLNRFASERVALCTPFLVPLSCLTLPNEMWLNR
jgi:hypothetical protein